MANVDVSSAAVNAISTTMAPDASSDILFFDEITTPSSGGNNTTIPENNTPYALVWYQLYFTPCFYALIAFLGLIGNGMVILVLLLFPNMKTIPNVYILNLAIVDFVFVISLPFLAVQVATNNWPFGGFMCKFVGGIDTFNQYASIYTLALMSADRYIAVVYPLSSMRYRTKTVSRCLCAMVWAVSGCLSIPMLILQKSYSYSSDLILCSIPSDSLSETQLKVYVMSNIFFGFLLPLTIILICYITLMCKIYASALPITTDGSAAQRAQKRVSFLVVSVIIVFIVCWLPYYTIQFVNIVSTNNSHGFRMAWTISMCWCYANSLFNPVIYTFIGENFKRNLLSLMHCSCPGVGKVERNVSMKDTSGVYQRGAISLHQINQGSTRQVNPKSMATDATSYVDSPSSCQKYPTVNSIKVVRS